jgi:hypothetical protein
MCNPMEVMPLMERRASTFLLGLLVLAIGATWNAGVLGEDAAAIKWTHLSSKKGDLSPPTISDQQTAALIFDADKDGLNDFVIACRIKGPAVVWFRREAHGWKRYVIEKETLQVEAGATCSDIDQDGDLDLVMGGDWQSNEVWWWENPYPDYDPNTPWKRRYVKDFGEKKHHHQLFGDFDGDGRDELAFWNQNARTLFLAEIPSNPRTTERWECEAIYTYSGGEHEGLAKADIDGDGKLDIVGGGRWFKHEGGKRYAVHVIDDSQRFARAAAGQLKKGGWGEAVFSPGDAIGRLKWYEWTGGQWVGHDPLGFDIVHGHSLELADFDGDGNLDIFSAEMHTPGHKEKAAMRIFLGDGKGNFKQTTLSTGIGNHESQVGDLDGDGDLDILDKPYTWDAPRIDVWLNNAADRGKGVKN